MTARLSVGDAVVEVTIEGYEFPDLEHDGRRITNDYEANDLLLVVEGSDGRRRWRVPFNGCLFTWEVLELAHWMERAAAGARPKWSFAGVEMDPEFGLSDDGMWLQVEFDVTSADPPLRMRADPEAMRRFALELRREVTPFPVRAIEKYGHAHQKALSLGAREGAAVAALSVRVPQAPPLTDARAGPRLASLTSIAPQAVQDFGGTTMPQWNGLVARRAEMRAIFPSATDCFRSARRLIEESVKAGLRLQIGVDFGMAPIQDDDDLGGSLARASEIAGVCEPGSILASEAACESAGESTEHTFHQHGAVQMSGADEVVPVFQVLS